MRMKKYAILTLFYRNYNYGGTLQAYALNQVINDMGAMANVVSYHNGSNRNPIYGNLKDQIKQYKLSTICNKVVKKIIEKFTFIIRYKIEIREKLFEDFNNKNVKSTIKYDDRNIKCLVSQYDGFISGSDQVWNPNSIRFPYLQTFAPDNCLKVSYAASISRDSLSEEEASVIIPAIKRFNHISVREETAKKILDSYGVQGCKVVLDPTLLLTESQWSEISSPRIINEKYVFCYFFTNSFKNRKKIQVFCRARNLKLLYIPYVEQRFNYYDAIGPGEKIFNVGPAEFISLIKNSEYVFTDSFHGLVFSMIFRKEFLVFKRDKNGSTSKNSRLTDMMAQFGLLNRLVTTKSSIEKAMSEKIKFDIIISTLEKKKKESRDFLLNALFE